jgi:hypothetical protein
MKARNLVKRLKFSQRLCVPQVISMRMMSSEKPKDFNFQQFTEERRQEK